MKSMNIYASDTTLVCYADNGTEIILGRALTNHGMTLDEFLALCDIDMDAYADANGWDGWDYDSLYTRPDYVPGFDWRSYEAGAYADECWTAA